VLFKKQYSCCENYKISLDFEEKGRIAADLGVDLSGKRAKHCVLLFLMILLPLRIGDFSVF
jgi:hypothetical protein